MISNENTYPIKYQRTLLSFLLVFGFCIGSFAINNPLNLRRACKAKNDSDIVLKWNIPTDACGSFQSYYIYGRSILTAPFDTIDSVNVLTQNQYIHKGAFLISNTWQYFVVVHYDCSGNPTKSSDTLSIDLTQTFNQYIDSVSVDPVTGKYIIGWKTNVSQDLAGYKIYTVSGTNNIELTDVDNATNLYTDNSSSPSTTVKTYSIAAYDSCNNITAIIDKHTPSKLSVSFDSCSHSFNLSWTGYIGFPLSKYEILISINGGSYFIIRDFLNVSGSLNYILNDTIFHNGDNTCFLIRARNANNINTSSSSNTVCLTVKFISLAQVNYISQVNVLDQKRIGVDWIIDQFSFISLALFQQSTNGATFTTRKAFTPAANSFSFIADSLNTDLNKYYFRVIIYNTCNQVQDTSLVCNSILLLAQKANAAFNRLTWNKYLKFDANVEKYEVYQGTGDPILGHTYNLSASIIPDSLGYSDGNFPENILNDGVCYYVVAYENAGNSFGVNSASCKSNEICIPGEMVVFFPNAFNPISLIERNNVFKPRGLYIDYDNSWMEIYNRWGELVFKTNDLLKGWNGNDLSGTPLPEGLYVCSSNIIALKGKNKYYKGFITLIR